MTDLEHISDSQTSEDLHGHSHRHHHRHKHKYRTRERVRIKSSSTSIKKKVKKYFTYFLWTILIALFFVSIFFLVKELNNAGIIKDRRNGGFLFFHHQINAQSIQKT